MSEYQYYEWQTIDRPLSAKEQAEVDELSSHIDVTSTRAVVTYNWGDFKHDPKQVLARYFDAFLYLANWGSKRFILRLPKGLVNRERVAPYLRKHAVSLEPAGGYLILDIALDEEGADSDWGDSESWLSSLARLRDEILQGDHRVLYLAWLAAMASEGPDYEDMDDEDAGYEEADYEETDDEEIGQQPVEPPVPPGLKELSASQERFVELFGLDPYLVQAAAQASPPRQPAADLELERVIAGLPRAEADAFLLRLAQGEPYLSVAFKRRLLALTGEPHPQATTARRTWSALLAMAKTLREQADQRAKEAAESRRIQDLKILAAHEGDAWREVHALIEKKNASAYKEAVALLVRLRDLAAYQARLADFQTRLADLMAKYSQRPALRERLLAARLT